MSYSSPLYAEYHSYAVVLVSVINSRIDFAKLFVINVVSKSEVILLSFLKNDFDSDIVNNEPANAILSTHNQYADTLMVSFLSDGNWEH